MGSRRPRKGKDRELAEEDQRGSAAAGKRSEPREPEEEVVGQPLGWTDGSAEGLGFHRGSKPQLITHNGNGHMITLGPTGSGKAVSAAMPELMWFPGNAIVFDTKAELFHVTARWRREKLGHRIILLDPFRIADSRTVDGLNPLDLAPLLGGTLFDAATTIASLFTGTTTRSHASRTSANDDFWQDQATQLLMGLIGAALEGALGDPGNFAAIRAIAKSYDAAYEMATMVEKKTLSQPFKEEITTFLNTVEVTRSGILSTLTSHFRGLGGEGVNPLLSETTFNLKDFVHGRLPATIYFVVPPEQMAAQARLVRLVLGTLMTALYTRRYIPPQKTLVQIDEAATLGQFEPLRTGITLFRGNGVSLHVLLQDLDQLYNNYSDARTIISNTSVFRLLGTSNYAQAADLAELFGVASRTLMNLDADEQLILIDGRPIRCRRLDYRYDEIFAGRFAPNPRYPASLQNGRGRGRPRPR